MKKIKNFEWNAAEFSPIAFVILVTSRGVRPRFFLHCIHNVAEREALLPSLSSTTSPGVRPCLSPSTLAKPFSPISIPSLIFFLWLLILILLLRANPPSCFAGFSPVPSLREGSYHYQEFEIIFSFRYWLLTVQAVSSEDVRTPCVVITVEGSFLPLPYSRSEMLNVCMF